MTKYYKVWLNENFHEKKANIFNEPIICKKNIFTDKFYKESVFIEILTGKVIYPSTSELRKTLTYAFVRGNNPISYEISVIEASEWLKSKTPEEIQQYIDNIYKLEQTALACYEEEQQFERKVAKVERKANKSLKRTIRQIKNK